MRFLAFALAAVLLPAAAAAPEGPTARDILRRAVEAQGSLRRDDIRDVTIRFVGEIAEEGRRNTVIQTQWYRSADRSFKVRTGSGATDKLTSERGVFGDRSYWERTTGGTVLTLRRGNRDDAASIRTIERERAEFERMLRMVLLSRLDASGFEVTMGEPAPVRLERDFPHEAKGALRDRGKETYHVLDATATGEPRLRLFVHTGDFTVRKAVEYDGEAADRIRRVYYFAHYRKDPALDLLLPIYLAVYRDTPVDAESRDALTEAKGEPKVELNAGLEDAVFQPAAAKG